MTCRHRGPRGCKRAGADQRTQLRFAEVERRVYRGRIVPQRIQHFRVGCGLPGEFSDLIQCHGRLSEKSEVVNFSHTEGKYHRCQEKSCFFFVNIIRMPECRPGCIIPYMHEEKSLF
jgi:hypothetical protein